MSWLPNDAWWSATAPLTGGSSARSPQLLERILDQFDVEHAPRYQRPPDGQTQCDTFVSDVTRALGCEVPAVELEMAAPPPCLSCHHQAKVGPRHVELDANGTAEWLDGPPGRRHGWVSCDEHAARAAADAGYPVVVTWLHLGGIGHVAVGTPAPLGLAAEDRRLWIAAAGSTNHRRCLVSQSFGNAPVRYFTHA